MALNLTQNGKALNLDSLGNLMVNVSAGGGGAGVQYVAGVVQSTPTGTVVLGKSPTNVLNPLATDATGNLLVNVALGGVGNPAAGLTGILVPLSGDYLAAKDGSGLLQGLLVESSSNPNLRISIYNGSTEVSVTGSNALKVDGSASTQPVSGTVSISGTVPVSLTSTTVTGTVAATESGVWSVRNQDGSGTALTSTSSALDINLKTSSITLPVSLASTTVTNTVTVSGTVTANAGTGTFAVSAASLPLPSGAATSAKQPALGTAGSASADVITIQGIASMVALKVDGSGTTQPVSGTITTTPPTNASTNITQFGGTNISTGTGVGGSGIPRVTVSSDSFPATQAVSGAVTANQGGTWTVQPGNTANTTAWKVDGSAVTQPVSGTITANAGTGNFTVTQATGTNLHAVIDAGSTTAVTGNVTVVQPTGTNLHVVVDTAPTTPVTGTITANQGGAPWSQNLIQVGGSALSLGQALSVSSIPVVLASNQNTLVVQDTADASVGSVVSSIATQMGGANGSTLRAINVDSLGNLVVSDRGGASDIFTLLLLELKAMRHVLLAHDRTLNPADFVPYSFQNEIISETSIN